jgi:hypothetical protein
MKLCEHPDFVQAILRASGHFRSRGPRPALVVRGGGPCGVEDRRAPRPFDRSAREP